MCQAKWQKLIRVISFHPPRNLILIPISQEEQRLLEKLNNTPRATDSGWWLLRGLELLIYMSLEVVGGCQKFSRTWCSWLPDTLLLTGLVGKFPKEASEQRRGTKAEPRNARVRLEQRSWAPEDRKMSHWR